MPHLVLPTSAPNLSRPLSRTILTSLFLLLLLAFGNQAQAQDCGCDHVITPDQGYIEAQNMPGGVEPGDVICIKAGVRGRLKLIGFQGTKEQPLTFINCGGQVIFDNTSLDGTFVFDKSRYFRVTGTGSPSHKYGFYIRTASKGSAMYVTESDFELDHIEIGNAGFAGIMAKVEAKCENKEYHRGNFVMQNVNIHDNYVHGTRGEGFYIGSSFYAGKDWGCGTVYSHEIHGLRMFNNIVENTGADGIQVGCATKDVEVYNNVVRKYGQDPFAPSQNMGIILNPGTTGKWYNNEVWDGTGLGFQVLGIGNTYLYNNLIVRPGGDGIFIDERTALLPNSGYHVMNNTIVNPGRDGIRMYSKNSVGSRFINNIVTQPASLSQNYYSKNQYLYLIDPAITITATNNLFLPKTADAGFVNAAGNNFQLQAGSPAIDKGASFTSVFANDLLSNPRPNGASFDIGAYEYTGNVSSSNRVPTVSAGTDKTISLPTNTLTLTGSASDADGSIASYSWNKVSGPSASQTGATTAQLGLSNLVEGSYVFRLTVKDNAGATAADDVTVTVKAATTTNTDGDSANASESNLTTTAPAPTGLNAPSNLGGVADKSTVAKLSWKDNASNESEFEIWMSAGTNSSYKLRAKAGTNQQAYTVTNLTAGQTYFFKVRAKNSSGYSDFSSEISLKMVAGNVATSGTTSTTTANTAPKVSAGENKTVTLPTTSTSFSGTATDADGKIASVSWSKVSGPSASMTNANSLNLTLSNLVEGSYVFRLTAKDDKGATASDDVQLTVAKAATTTTAPAPTGLNAPSNLGGVADKSTVAKLSWKDNASNESEFEIWMSAGTNSSYKLRAKAGTNQQAYTVTNLTAGQTYFFKVRAKNSSGYSAFSSEISLKMVAGNAATSGDTSSDSNSSTLVANAAPTASAGTDQTVSLPTNTLTITGTATDKDGSIASINWSKLSGPSVSMRNASTTLGSTVAMELALSNLVEGTYTFRLAVKDNEGATATDDVVVTVKKEGTGLNAPSNLAGVADKTTAVKLSWKDNASNESEFEIWMSAGNTSSYKLRAKAGTNQTYYTVTNLTQGQTYYFKVRAKNWSGYSDYSNEISFKMEAGAVSTSTPLNTSSSAYMGSNSDTQGYYTGTADATATDLSQSLDSSSDLEALPDTYSAYPNPAADYINLRYENLNANSQVLVKVIDLAGNVRLEVSKATTGTSGIISLNLQEKGLASGYYILQIESETGTKTIKFLKM